MQDKKKNDALIEEVAAALCAPLEQGNLSLALSPVGMPDLDVLRELMSRLRAALFPGFFGSWQMQRDSFRFHLTANLDSICALLQDQIYKGLCFVSPQGEAECWDRAGQSEEMALQFIAALPKIREFLASDVKAAYEGDPAARTPGETIFCYPSIAAMLHHRVAHAMYRLEMPLIPRIISEMAHSQTGIDIHPGATIGREFFIDHGTGVVIGETSIIGEKCRLYQGVTLGALSFVKDERGILVKGQPRHPILGDRVTVYAGATILGRVTIGSDSIIGGNVWLTHDVPDGSRIVQQRSTAPKDKERIVGNE